MLKKRWRISRQAVILDGKPARCSFDLRSRFACDGSIEVFIERLVKPNAFLEGLIGVLGNRTPITVVDELSG